MRQTFPSNGSNLQRPNTLPQSTNRPSFSSDRLGGNVGDRMNQRPNLSFPATQQPSNKLPPVSGGGLSGNGSGGNGNGWNKPNFNRPPDELGNPLSRPGIKPAPKPTTRPSLGNVGQATTLPAHCSRSQKTNCRPPIGRRSPTRL